MVWRLNLCHLDQGDPEGPDVSLVVVRTVLGCLAHHHLWSHPGVRHKKKRNLSSPLFSADACVSVFISKSFFVLHLTHQYGVPMKESLLWSVLVFLADTPKSAGSHVIQAKPEISQRNVTVITYFPNAASKAKCSKRKTGPERFNHRFLGMNTT